MTTEAALNRQLVLSGEVFFGAAFDPAVGGQLSHTQLWNPAASGVRLEVFQIYGSFTNFADLLKVSPHATALTTLIANGVSMLNGVTASAAELRSQTQVAGIGSSKIIVDVPVAQPFIVPGLDKIPLVLEPDRGLIVAGSVNANRVNSNFVWRELPA